MWGCHGLKNSCVEGTSLEVQWLRLQASTEGAWVQLLVGELRYTAQHSQRKEKEKKLSSIRIITWDFPGGPVVKNLPSDAGDKGSIPSQGTKIPYAVG